jgi:hypothetical protein
MQNAALYGLDSCIYAAVISLVYNIIKHFVDCWVQVRDRKPHLPSKE